MAATADHGLQGLLRILPYLIKGTVKSDLHAPGAANHLAGESLVNLALAGKEAHHHSISPILLAHINLAPYHIQLYLVIAEIATTRTNQDMDPQAQRELTMHYILANWR